jgi:RNA polymerase sigma-70 factor (family 1)
MANRQEEGQFTQTILTKKQFGDFFRENYHTACLVALRYITDSARAEDLVQDVFCAIWEKKETLKIKTGLKNYFLAAVKNHAINQAQRGKANTVSLSVLLVDLAEEEKNERFKDEELAVKIASAIAELPPACRSIFSLAYREKMTYQQIADRLNVSKNTVKTQMGIAYRQLREKLKKWVVVLFSLNNLSHRDVEF